MLDRYRWPMVSQGQRLRAEHRPQKHPANVAWCYVGIFESLAHIVTILLCSLITTFTVLHKHFVDEWGIKLLFGCSGKEETIPAQSQTTCERLMYSLGPAFPFCAVGTETEHTLL